MFTRLIVIMAVASFTTGCAQSRYLWNGYDDRLYNYYKNPAETEPFIEGLYETILKSEAENRVPPGIYAEYGYMLYERGKFSEAIVWYNKERDKWPESRLLMDKMISLAVNRKGKSGSKTQGASQVPASTSQVGK